MRVCVCVEVRRLFLLCPTKPKHPSLQDRTIHSQALPSKHLMPQLRSASLPRQRSSTLLRLRSATHRLLTETQRLQSHHACRFCVFSLDFGFGSSMSFRIPGVCLPLLLCTTFPNVCGTLDAAQPVSIARLLLRKNEFRHRMSQQACRTFPDS